MTSSRVFSTYSVTKFLPSFYQFKLTAFKQLV